MGPSLVWNALLIQKPTELQTLVNTLTYVIYGRSLLFTFLMNWVYVPNIIPQHERPLYETQCNNITHILSDHTH